MPHPLRSDLQDQVVEVLRAAGRPLGTGEILERLPTQLQGCSVRDVGVVVRAHPMCAATLRGQYVHLPTALCGAEVYLPTLPGATASWLTLPMEAYALLWPDRWTSFRGAAWRSLATRLVQVTLPSGTTAIWQRDRVQTSWMAPPDTPRPSDAGFLLRCVDAEAGSYEVRACAPEDTGGQDAQAEWLRRATPFMQAGREYDPELLALRLLAGGVYHGKVPRATMQELMAGPPFVNSAVYVAYRPDISPALWRIFASHTLLPAWSSGEDEPPPLPPPITSGYSYVLRASVGRGFRADVELSAEHSLYALHLALQEALRWDQHHLHAFYLSGRDRDSATEVLCPEARRKGPHSAEVTFGHFDPQPGGRFIYLFDFGDEWKIPIEVLERRSGSPAPTSPRLLDTRGTRPRQYPEHF